MKKLLIIEWIKLRKYRAFWVLLLLFALACIGIYSFVYNFQGKLVTSSAGMVQLHLFSGQNIWHTTAWLNNFTLMLPGVLMILLMANEFSYKTLRQVIINGLSRGQAIVSKWLLLGMIAVTCWLIYFLIVVVMGKFFLGTEDLFLDFHYAGYSFLNMILGLSVAFILTLWIKRSGLTIAVYLVYCLFFESISDYFLDKINVFLGEFLPLSSGAALTPNPFNKIFADKSAVAHQPAVYWYLLATILWISLILVISRRYIRRADL